MIVIGAAMLVGAALGLEIAVQRIHSPTLAVVDAMIVPVLWFAIRRSQRSAMLVGCAGGLFHDAWFETAAFGVGGFSLTFLGWVIGGVATRFELSRRGTRAVVGAFVALADSGLQLGLRRLLDQVTATPSLGEWALRAVVVALMAALFFPWIDRAAGVDGADARYRRY